MLENYNLNADGVLYQVERTPFVYDTQYVDDRYNTYGELNAYMSHLRLGYIVGAIGKIPNSLIDIGYGNGAFLKTCTQLIPECYGFDVSGYPVPDGVTFAEDWKTKPVDVITFFDVLEHFEDPYFIRDLQAEFVVISLPWCVYRGDEWFAEWKHRRPNEHLWFFDHINIGEFAKATGYDVLHVTNLEDTIRRSADGTANIMTVTLKKIQATDEQA